MALRSHGDSRLQHVIKLGAHTEIQRYLRITLSGHLQPPGSGAAQLVWTWQLLAVKDPCNADALSKSQHAVTVQDQS